MAKRKAAKRARPQRRPQARVKAKAPPKQTIQDKIVIVATFLTSIILVLCLLLALTPIAPALALGVASFGVTVVALAVDKLMQVDFKKVVFSTKVRRLLSTLIVVALAASVALAISAYRTRSQSKGPASIAIFTLDGLQPPDMGTAEYSGFSFDGTLVNNSTERVQLTGFTYHIAGNAYPASFNYFRDDCRFNVAFLLEPGQSREVSFWVPSIPASEFSRARIDYLRPTMSAADSHGNNWNLIVNPESQIPQSESPISEYQKILNHCGQWPR